MMNRINALWNLAVAIAIVATGYGFAAHHESGESATNEGVAGSPSNIWTYQAITFKDGQRLNFRQGLREFMQTDLGKQFPGTIGYSWILSDGDDPATHGMVMSFPNTSAWAKWNGAFFTGGTSEAQKWGQIYSDSVDHASTFTLTQVVSWGEPGQYGLTEVIPFYTANLAAFTEAFTGFMGTETGRSFPGRVAIHQCSYCGEQEANAMFSVQHSTPEAFDDWRETSASSKDFQEWVQTAFAMAKFTGSNLIAALDLYPVNSTALLQ